MFCSQVRLSNWPKESPGSWFSEFKRGKIVSQLTGLFIYLFSLLFIMPHSYHFQIGFSILGLYHFSIYKFSLSILCCNPLSLISFSFFPHSSLLLSLFSFKPPPSSLHPLIHMSFSSPLLVFIFFPLFFFHIIFLPVDLCGCGRKRHQFSADDLPEAAELRSTAELHLYLPSVCGLVR